MVYLFRLEKFSITEKKLFISISGCSSYHDSKPKISLIFDNKTENRRMPLKINSFFIDHSHNQYFIHGACEYDLEHIFWNKNNYQNITLRLSLMHGEEYFENLELDFNDEILDSDQVYYEVTRQSDEIIISPKQNLVGYYSLLKKYQHFLTIYSYLLLLVGILLIPFFAVDGFLALKGFSEKSPDFQKNRRPAVNFLFHINWKIYEFSNHGLGRRRFNQWLMGRIYSILKHRKIKENQIAFISERRNDISGNFDPIYHETSKNPEISIVKFLNNKPIKNLNIFEVIEYVNILSTSKIILLDDFLPSIHTFDLKDETKLVQLWHAVGAFKTFGFTRIGKKGGPEQFSPNHRSYDYSIVSSREIVKFYAEGFGLSEEKVLATGIPRTDVFFDNEYKKKVESEFYSKYPNLVNKKILLFAPTFRGDGKQDAHYPIKLFPVNQIYESIGDDWAIIIKQHPFVKGKTEIYPEFEDYILDLSHDSEINDLLFISDLIVTDYSSVIFEASLLNIPMLFYAYDLEEYINSRDFYYEYKTFVPGKIVFNSQEIVSSILNEDFESNKIDEFKGRFFDHLDGMSTERVLNLLYSILDNNK